MSRQKMFTMIAAKADVDAMTVRRFFDGTTTPHSITKQAILSAAKELKIDLKSLRKKAA